MGQMIQQPISRRTVLRGLGVSLALPWFESHPSWRLWANDLVGGQPPLRFVAMFVPNGIHMSDWKPTTEGFGFKLPFILEPLAPVQDDLLVITGLAHDKGRANGDGPGDHARSASVFLTGAQPRKTSGADIRSGKSADQVAAQAVGHLTRFPSLQLGCEGGRSAGNCDSGYSCAYSSNISWASEDQPLTKEINPRSVFERLFGAGQGAESEKARVQRLLLKKSLLDTVASEAKRLQAQLGKQDQRKLDEYLTGVREIERRIELVEKDQQTHPVVDYPLPTGIPADYAAHIRIMMDLMVLALQTDSTRVISMMLADAGSNRSYRMIDIPDGHHDLSHHGGDPVKHDKIRRINRFHVSQLSYFLQKLKSIPEGEETLLDHCIVLYGSGLSDGNRHNHDDLPVLIAGRGGGAIDTGRHLRLRYETPMCNLLLSIVKLMGANVSSFGDSTDQLSLTV